MTIAKNLLNICESYQEALIKASTQATTVKSHTCEKFYFDDNSAIEIHLEDGQISEIFHFDFNDNDEDK